MKAIRQMSPRSWTLTTRLGTAAVYPGAVEQLSGPTAEKCTIATTVLQRWVRIRNTRLRNAPSLVGEAAAERKGQS